MSDTTAPSRAESPRSSAGSLSPYGAPTRQPVVKSEAKQGPAAFCGVVLQSGSILITLTTLEMWGTSGFLFRCFQPFNDHSISIDQVATSQSGISVTVSYVPGGMEGDAYKGLIDALSQLGDVEVIQPVSIVTVVGRKIREGLPALGRGFQAFQGVDVLMVSASSEDVAMSFVVREDVAQQLVEVLHRELVPVTGGDQLYGGTRVQMFGPTYEEIKLRDRQRRESAAMAQQDDAAAAVAAVADKLP